MALLVGTQNSANIGLRFDHMSSLQRFIYILSVTKQ